MGMFCGAAFFLTKVLVKPAWELRDVRSKRCHPGLQFVSPNIEAIMPLLFKVKRILSQLLYCPLTG